MRTKRTIINLLYTLGSSFVLLLLGLVARALFVSNFDISIPGTSTVIEQLFHRRVRGGQRHQLPAV